jgi:hypothetical protein
MGGERKSRSGRLRPGKIITHVIVFLLLLSGGAIVNIAVAWAWLTKRSGLVVADSISERPSLAVDVFARLQQKKGRWLSDGKHYRSIGYHVFVLYDVSPGTHYQELTYAEAGLPLMAFEGARVVSFPFWKSGGPAEGTIQSCFEWRSGFESFVPVRPVWPGFAINTLFYAIMLWLLIPGPFVLRRLIRRKRGRCPKCGYDLRGAPSGGGCPECGWNRQPEATP